MARFHEKLGSWVLHRKWGDIGLEGIPQYNLYKDKTQNEESFQDKPQNGSYFLNE